MRTPDNGTSNPDLGCSGVKANTVSSVSHRIGGEKFMRSTAFSLQRNKLQRDGDQLHGTTAFEFVHNQVRHAITHGYVFLLGF